MQGVDLDLPIGQLLCFAGRSGSGAKAMAVDVLFAESQRRYSAALSPCERRGIKGTAPAAVEQISGLPPAILLSERLGRARRRHESASVGSFLQTAASFAELFVRFGEIACPACGDLCESFDVEAVVRRAIQQSWESVLVIAPIVFERTSSLKSILQILQQTGFTRLFVGGQVVRHDELTPVALEEAAEQELLVVVDRVRSIDGGQRLREAVRTARAMGRGRSLFAGPGVERAISLNQMLTCRGCAQTYDDPLVEDLLTTPVRRAFSPEHISLQGRSLHTFLAMRIDEVADFTTQLIDLATSSNNGPALAECRAQIEDQRSLLRVATGVSLGHLHLDSSLSQLSTGEYLRLVIATNLSAGLVGILYVCETPVSMLDEEALEQTLSLLRQLVDRGNTVVLLENAARVQSAADAVLWFDHGALSNPDRERVSDSTDAGASSDRESAVRPLVRDLPDITVAAELVPALHSPTQVMLTLGQLTCVTGVSGSGKSSLLRELILPAFGSSSQRGKSNAARVGVKSGANPIRKARLIGDDGDYGEATVLETLGLFGKVTGLFARTPVAQQRGYASVWFQLGGPGGRCPSCEGRGRVRYDMEFLDDLDLSCPTCEGRRFQPEVLEITWRGRSMADLLMMNAMEATAYFDRHDTLSGPLATACSCGLTDCLLGEKTADLDSSVALRLQLCAIQDRVSEKDLILLDNPGAGAHADDVGLLLDLLGHMGERGATIVVAESRPEVLAAAARIVEMGPGRGVDGGRVLA